MINSKNARILQAVEELPPLPEAVGTLYLDLETTSFDSSVEAFLPYNGHRFAGSAITWDDNPLAYYIPVRHTMGKNLPLEPVLEWLQQILNRSKEWVNHNVKFDAHFLAVDGIFFDGPMVDTLTLSKLHNSDRFQHDLESLGTDWLGLKFEEYTRVQAFLKGMKSKNYGDVPIDILGEYACWDVQSNRLLWKFLLDNRPEQVLRVWDTEIKMTSVLFDMEREGLRVDLRECKEKLVLSLRKMIDLSDKLHEATQREFTDHATVIFDILINQLGLPVLSYNEDSGSPSFDKEALALYKVHPDVTSSERNKEILEWISEYRTEKMFKGLFLETFIELADTLSRVHPSYNQTVRTGRMSCKNPNAQQQNDRSKELVHPSEEEGFLSCDASQIEFRIIIHYIEDIEGIRAYNEDKKMDIHEWTGKEVGVKRKPAKRINFGVGYGAGKRKVVSMLMADPDVMEEVGEIINELVLQGKIRPEDRAREFKRLCQKRGEMIYHKYHERFPGIKKTSDIAMRNCKRRGYCFNAFGRRRHLSPRHAHKAFNTVVQGTAGDYVKDRMVALAPRFNPQMREWNIRIAANVHDELLFTGPIPTLLRKDVQDYINSTLEHQSVPFKVPFYWGMGYSARSWAEAGGDNVVFIRDGVEMRVDKKKYEPKDGDAWVGGPVLGR